MIGRRHALEARFMVGTVLADERAAVARLHADLDLELSFQEQMASRTAQVPGTAGIGLSQGRLRRARARRRRRRSA